MTSKLLETAKKFIGHFETLDTDVLESVLAEDYVQQFTPASMNMPGPLDKRSFISHVSKLRDIMTGFPVTGKEYIVSEESNQVVVWATSVTHFREELKDDTTPKKDWDYRGEYVFMLKMDASGEKIVRTVEFLDSQATVNGLQPLRKIAKDNLAKRVTEGKQ